MTIEPTTAILDDLDEWLHWSPSLDRWLIAPAKWVVADRPVILSELQRRYGPLKRSVVESEPLLEAFKTRCAERAEPVSDHKDRANRAAREWNGSQE